MRAQIMSDLHIDFHGPHGIPRLAQGAALVVVAGDTCQGLVRAIDALRSAYPNCEIVMVAGNHEYYGFCLPDELSAGRARAKDLGVHLLECNTVVIDNLRIIGATTWTDYDLFGEELRIPAMRTAAGVMMDHKRIKWRKQPWHRFRPDEARALHLQSRAYIDKELAKSHHGPSLVLTHHAATIEAVAPQFQRSLISAAYASELLPIVDRHQPDWWVSGHTHMSLNFQRGKTRLISNPAGYGDENPSFDTSLIIEVNHD
jgi:predicted phosphodiesterase